MADTAPMARWQLAGDGITWDVQSETRLPHQDHLEMSGRHVSLIARYEVGSNRDLRLTRRIYWPALRGRADDVRGYLRREFGELVEPAILIAGSEDRGCTARLARVSFDGVLAFEHAPHRERGLQLTRRLFPSPDQPAVVEQWCITNRGDEPQTVRVAELHWRQDSGGVYGRYELSVDHVAADAVLQPGGTLATAIVFAARRGDRPAPGIVADAALAGRRARCQALRQSLRLESPDPVLNRCFAFACQRTAESLFETKMGLVHSPGGNSYYGGVWANDQVEYAGPFFPFIGDAAANLAALNAYRIFARAMGADYRPIPSSFEVEGDKVWTHCGDRGDAAMYLYGCSRYLLARGERSVASELWPALEWCAEYCRRRTNADGVVASDTDELEGRFPTGRANLSTSALAYGGYRAAAAVARGLGHDGQAAELTRRAEALETAIERTFGAEVEGYATYRYFAGCTLLRSWICLPLTMGIVRRAQGTIAALFSPRLWTADGLATQAGDRTFWDRATLYGLRGVFAAGDTETALHHLTALSQRRLLGDHVPYMVEAWPEGGQAHLAAESALYGRVFTEGLFGITPTGFTAFSCRPRLPAAWERMALRGVHAFGQTFDLEVERHGSAHVRAVTTTADGRRQTRDLDAGQAAEFCFA